MDMQSPEVLAAIEEALVRHQAFGKSDYIIGQLEVAFIRRLERIAADLPVAGKLLTAFARAGDYERYRIAGNTVIRCAVQHAYTELECGKPSGLPRADCEQVLEATRAHLEQGRLGSPFENGPIELQRLGPGSYHGWIWSEDYPDDIFGRSFRRLLDLEYGGPLCSIDADELAMLQKGEALLRELLPSLAKSALTHAHQIGCFPDAGFWKGKVSSSQIRMGGTIFLNRQMLRNPWCTAEHLLHESLHQKLYDFRHGHSLLNPEGPGADAPRVIALWNAQELSQANHWDTHRAFAALHVYTQLALLATIAERRAAELEAEYGRYCGLVESRNALDRARYLGEKLKEVCADELGMAGERMLGWLMSILDYLDPSPPSPGASIHLLLDLYVREANRIDAVIGSSEAAIGSFSRDLTPAVEQEIEDTRRIFLSLDATAERQRFEEALGQYAGEEPGRHFPAVRRLIAQSLLATSQNGHELASRATDGSDPDQAVRNMVEAGSERLYLLQTNVPAAVAGAKRRAKDMRFVSACQDDLGRLLAMLAAAAPPGGRILEVGTGVGQGLAWIVTGLRNRSDVEVVSIEGDVRLSESAQRWPWPEQVRIVTADALEVLPALGRFDLVFADAAPVKYGDLGAMLGTLRTGGILIVDDLCATAEASEQEQLERDTLRLSLLRHPDLQVVELDWSSRVILATMIGPQRSEASDAPHRAATDPAMRSPAQAMAG